MSAFNLTIRTNNAAFHTEDGEHAPEHEVARLLREAADKTERGVTRASLNDYNGNNVGSFEFTREGWPDHDPDDEGEDGGVIITHYPGKIYLDLETGEFTGTAEEG